MLNPVVHIVIMSQDSILCIEAPCGLNVPGIDSRGGSLPCLLYNRLPGHSPGAKLPARGVSHPPETSAEVKETVELYLYSPHCAFVACCSVNLSLHMATNWVLKDRRAAQF